MPAADLKGKVFGSLTVLRRVENNKHKSAQWECLCACGKTTVLSTGCLTSGNNKGCGCVLRSPKRKDLTGRRFGKLLVLGFSHQDRRRAVYWKCRCDCGKETAVRVNQLKSGRSRSCGCIRVEVFMIRTLKHGRSKEPTWIMWLAAKKRAEKENIPFTIAPEDVVIPERCPVFGIPLISHKGRVQNDSPSLDKVKPHLGYVPGNVAVISYKANALKRDMGVQEFRKFIEYVEKYSGHPLSE